MHGGVVALEDRVYREFGFQASKLAQVFKLGNSRCRDRS